MTYTAEFRQQIVEAILSGKRSKTSIKKEYGLHKDTLDKWLKRAPPNEKGDTGHVPLSKQSDVNIQTSKESASKTPNIIYVDTEVIPSLGLFYERFNDRGIPLPFIIKPKALITIQYAFNDDEPTVLIADSPYDDKDILAQ